MTVVIDHTKVVDTFTTDSGERIIKLHLFDDSLNLHGWGISGELAAALAGDYVGSPYIIPPTLNHPVRPYPALSSIEEDIADIQRYAKPYEAGVIFKTDPCVSCSHSKYGFDGYVKLTNQKAIEAFDKGLIPRHASISLYNLDSANNDGYLKKAKALNVCAVAIPAYSEAKLLGRCVGSEDNCHTNLRNAGIQKEEDYCILKTLETSNFDKFIDTSLNSEREKQASLGQMSQTIANNNNVISSSPPSPSTIQTSGTTVPVTQPIQQQQPQQEQTKATTKEPQLDQQTLNKINEEIDVVANTKEAYDKLKLEFEQRDAILQQYARQIAEFQRREEELKQKEIERYVTIDTFNGDTKLHSQKVGEWKDRATKLGVDDLSYYLQESYGRRPYKQQDKEKKAGLQYEPTAVLSASASADSTGNTEKFSVFDAIGGSY